MGAIRTLATVSQNRGWATKAGRRATANPTPAAALRRRRGGSTLASEGALLPSCAPAWGGRLDDGMMVTMHLGQLVESRFSYTRIIGTYGGSNLRPAFASIDLWTSAVRHSGSSGERWPQLLCCYLPHAKE